MFNQSSTQLKGIDKDLTKEKKVNNTFENFTNSLRSLVFALILGGASALGIRAFRRKGMMSEAAITDLLQEMGQDARRGKTGMKGGFMEMMTEDELLDYLRGKQIREFERDFGYLDDDAVKPTKIETKPNVVKKKRTPRVIRKKVQPQKVLSEVLVLSLIHI